MNRQDILKVINDILTRQGHAIVSDSETALEVAKFRSVDFSEASIRIEDALDTELNFEAIVIRQIQTIKDVIDFFEAVVNEAAPSN